MTDATTQKIKWKKLLLPTGIGAVSGFLAAFAFLQFTDSDVGTGLTGSEEIAGLVAIIYILTGLAVLVGVLSPNTGAKVLNVEDADELREQRVQLGYSAVGMAAFGIALLVLALAGPTGWIAPMTGAILAIVLILFATALSFFMTRHIDELQRELSRDAMGMSFSLVTFFGGGWALLAHTGLLSAPAPIDWLTMFAAALLIAAFWQTGKRGLLMRGPN